MSKRDDPALYESNWERQPKDRYWTEPWVTGLLMRRLNLSALQGRVWESAAGRGDMVQVLLDHGLDVFASDVDMSEFDGGMCDCAEIDFLDAPQCFVPANSAIITNPPYNIAEEFIRQALSFDEIDVVAMILRTEFRSAAGRTDLFENAPFAFEIVMTNRPRWDWWFRKKPEASPRHNFSWLVWDKRWDHESTTYWEGKNLRSEV